MNLDAMTVSRGNEDWEVDPKMILGATEAVLFFEPSHQTRPRGVNEFVVLARPIFQNVPKDDRIGLTLSGDAVIRRYDGRRVPRLGRLRPRDVPSDRPTSDDKCKRCARADTKC